MTATETYTTLPKMTATAGENLDTLREFLRKRSDLAALGVAIGGARLFTVEDANRIVAEFRARPRKRKSATV